MSGMNKDMEDMSAELYKNTMYLQKNLILKPEEAHFDEKVISKTKTVEHRFERDEKHLLEFIKAKEEERKKFEDLETA